MGVETHHPRDFQKAPPATEKGTGPSAALSTSGGPTVRQGQTEMVGINHSHGEDTGSFIPDTDIKKFLADYFQRTRK